MSGLFAPSFVAAAERHHRRDAESIQQRGIPGHRHAPRSARSFRDSRLRSSRGTIVGVAIGRIKFIDRFTSVYVSALFAVPMTAILPLFSLWFGFTSDARLATVVFASFFSIVVNVSDGGARGAAGVHRGIALVSRQRVVAAVRGDPAGVNAVSAGGLAARCGARTHRRSGRGIFHNDTWPWILYPVPGPHPFTTTRPSSVCSCAGRRRRPVRDAAAVRARPRFLPWYRRGEPGG